MKLEHCVEVATFKLKPGVSDDQVLALEARIRAGEIAGSQGSSAASCARTTPRASG
jgi:hypothetical protein